MSVWTIVVAAGSGTRFGGDKVTVHLGNQRVLDRTLATTRRASDGVVVVLPVNTGETAESLDVAAVVSGGDTRSASVRAGLAAVPDDAEWIIVHDAARPLASEALFRSVISAAEAGNEAVLPGLALSDTIKRVRSDGDVTFVDETVDRSTLVAVQTPQIFRADLLRKAHASSADATDDAGLVEAMGARVAVVPGEVHNRKITTPEDLAIMAAWS